MARVLSGIQPTGDMHLGNYLGAVRRWVEEQDTQDALYCVVDLHALTVDFDPATLAEQTRRTAMLLLAAGLDPERCTLFVQSHVAAHTELTWLLNCVATMGELRRMTQFKDKGKGQESVSVGLFDYPVLMVSDILLYEAEEVPIGDDQRQHLELARDIAGRFNQRFGQTFVVPKPTFPAIGARVMDLQRPTDKMSKSAESVNGVVLLLDEPTAITKKLRSAVTDSGSDVRYDPVEKPGISNLLEVHSAATARPIPELEAEYGTGGYGTFKSAVADAVVELLAPVRERYAELARDPAEVDRLLARGAKKARAIAGPVLERARRAAGLLPETS
jgi:tryptophanyl-tRNA synthetase